jgi:CubicO group peptidase (beta-lactamase class C family)
MQETALGLPERLKKRIVPVVVRDTTPGLFDPLLIEGMNYIVAEDTELPSGGAVSTVHDVFLFAEMLRRGGQLNGTRVLSPETVELATTNQTGALPNHLMSYMREMYGWPEIPAYLGLTFFVRGKGLFPTPLGLNTSPRTFGGLGAGSTVFWVDPERALTYVFLSAGLMEDGHSIMRHQRLSDMVVASVVA